MRLLRLLLLLAALALPGAANTLIAFVSNNNWTTAGNWATAFTGGTGAPLLDSEVGTDTIGTGTSDSATFTPGVIALSGIIFKIQSRSASPGTNTCSVILRHSSTNDKTVTFQVSDMAASARGWYFAKFAGDFTTAGSTTYLVRMSCSAASMMVVYRDGTTNNHSRLLPIGTTNNAPGAGDHIIVSGFFLDSDSPGAGLHLQTMNMDGTATTIYGATSFTESIAIADGGTLTNATAASTSYNLKWAGIFRTSPGGTLNVGTSGGRMPSNSSATYTMSVASNVDTGMDLQGGTINMYGATKTTCTLLTANIAAAGTVVTVADTTGWAVSDVLAFASTTQTASQSENKTILTVDSGTQVTLTAGITNAHSGTSPTQGEVCSTARNLKITGTSGTLQGYIQFNGLGVGTFNFSHVEFTLLGSNTANKRGFDISTTSGTLNIDNCSIHDFTVAGSALVLDAIAVSGTVAITNNVIYNQISNGFMTTGNSSGWSFTGNTVIKSGGSGILLSNNTITATISNNTFTGNSTDGITLSAAGNGGTTFSGNTFHSNNAIGFNTNLAALTSLTISSSTVWRNNGRGMDFNATNVTQGNLTISGTNVLFGNNPDNIRINGLTRNVDISGVTSNGDTTFSTTNGITTGNQEVTGFTLWNSSFSQVTGIKTAHTSDLNLGTGTNQIIGDFVKFGGTTPVAGTTAMGSTPSYVRIGGYNQAANTHRSYFLYGQIDSDTSVYNTASPSEKITPNNASNKICSGERTVAIASGHTGTVTVYVRKSTTAHGDATSYGGAQPRLIERRNYAAGIAADIALDTMTVADNSGTWEQLTGTTATLTDNGVIHFCVDGDGTTGFFNTDDWTAVQN